MHSEKIISKEPFMAARVGFNEMSMMKAYDFHKKGKFKDVLTNMCDAAGFFPYDYELGYPFLKLMEEAFSEVDVLALMNSPLEDYYANHYLRAEAQVTPFQVMDFWNYADSWTKALEGKKVLVVHPFVDTIQKQYEKREKIFTNEKFLPQFELTTYKAVQTAGGEKDSRFSTWFEALDFMSGEIAKLDFDIAIVGCGAYGFPLAAGIKKTGRQVVHMGGVSQILFGIKGNRWMKKNSTIVPFMNEEWIWPSPEETPVDVNKMEGGPYFQCGNYFELPRGKAD